MLRYFNISLVLISLTAQVTLRAAAKSHAAPASEATVTWTNDDLARFSSVRGLISIVGPDTDEGVRNVDTPSSQPTTEDSAWYAARAASLHAQLEAEKAKLGEFIQAFDDARELKNTKYGINLAEDDSGITPEATIEILQNRVRETQSELDALEDLARQHGIPPGILRGQWQAMAEDDEQGRH